jgi:hypothetical protein
MKNHTIVNYRKIWYSHFHYIKGNRYPAKWRFGNEMVMFLNKVDSSMESIVELLYVFSIVRLVFIYLVLPFLVFNSVC